MDNPKNSLVRSVPFRALCQGNANKLPISMRRAGPDHAMIFTAELPVPLSRGQMYMASGKGRNKPEAEKNCCIDAAKKLMEEGLLDASMSKVAGGGPSKISIPEPAKECPPIVSLREADLDYMEEVLSSTRADFLETPEVASLDGAWGQTKSTSRWADDEPDGQDIFSNEINGYRPSAALSAALREPQYNGWGDPRGSIDKKGASGGLLGKTPCVGEDEEDERVKVGQKVKDEPDRDFGQKYFSEGKRQISEEDERLQKLAEQRKTGPEFAEQRAARTKLPAWRHRDMVLDAVSKSQVVVLTGETGCGKTTQVPQFLLEDQEEKGKGSDTHIIITQPRRIAAISVAERVAWERGEPLGQSVGYAIRLESVLPRPRGSLLFCTTGMLLRRLQRADGISGVSHIVIDEVHERDVDTDFLLVLVRELLQHCWQLKVVIMSATLDATIFTRYFNGCPAVSIPGFTHPVQVHYLEDLPGLMGSYCPPVVYAALNRRLGTEEEEVDPALTAAVVTWVAQHFATGDGAVLCFLPGWDLISGVQREFSRLGSASRSLHFVPLHSQLPSGEQREAFSRAPAGMRKVVLSTNIAETSVTIDDIVYVIDTGRSKEKSYDPTKDLATMRLQWTSQASARQRQGRAGRVRPGHCFRLYHSQVHESMRPHAIPEMQRVPLEEICLSIKSVTASGLAFQSRPPETRPVDDASRGLIGRAPSLLGGSSTRGQIEAFLSRALQPPSMVAVRSAIQCLQQLGALDEKENLLPLGKTLGKLAVHPRLGKMLVYGSLLGCVSPLLTVAAASCTRDPFLCPASKREEADSARAQFAVDSSVASDQLTVARAYEEWEMRSARGQAAQFCDSNFLSMAGMKLISGMRMQFQRTLAEVAPPENWPSLVDKEMASRLARSVMVAGLYPNVAHSEQCRESKSKGGGKQSYRYRFGFKAQDARVVVHPTSVISEKKLNQTGSYFLVFQEKVQTTQVFVRGCTLLPHFAVALFGGSLQQSREAIPPSFGIPSDWILLEVDRCLKFVMSRRAASLLLEFRRVVDKVMERWVSSRRRTESERRILECAIHLLDSTCRDALS